MGQFSVEKLVLPGQLSVEINSNELLTSHRSLKLTTLAELPTRYRNEINSKKRSSGPESYMLGTQRQQC
jgi:hypothetical protein